MLIPRRLFRTGVVTCIQHRTWSNVSVKRKAVASQHGQLRQRIHLEDIALRKALHERYLGPFLTTQGQYLAHLESLSRGVSVRPIQGVPILLFAGELPEEEDNQFIRWVYRKRHLAVCQRCGPAQT